MKHCPNSFGGKAKKRKLIAVGSFWNANVCTGSFRGFGLTVADPILVQAAEDVIQSSLSSYQRLSTTDQSRYIGVLYDQLRWVSAMVGSTRDSQGVPDPNLLSKEDQSQVLSFGFGNVAILERMNLLIPDEFNGLDYIYEG